MFIPVNIRAYISLSLLIYSIDLSRQCVRVYVCARACAHVYIHVYIHIYIYICVCVHYCTLILHAIWVCIYIYYMRVNPFFLLLKHLQIEKKIGLVWHFRLSLVGHNWILNCGNWESIAEQDGETMGSTCSTPYINKNRLPPGFFLLGSNLTSFILIYYIIIIHCY